VWVPPYDDGTSVYAAARCKFPDNAGPQNSGSIKVKE
jgi:hypothetical protein